MSPNAGEGRVAGVVSANENICAHHVTWSPNKLWRFDLTYGAFPLRGICVDQTEFFIYENNYFLRLSSCKKSRTRIVKKTMIFTSFELAPPL
jgi:hypothetical protein